MTLADVPGVIVAAPCSGSGKTLTTLALLAALRRRGVVVGSAKVGPDYIDPHFHEAASGRPCVNLDHWAMRGDFLRALADRITDGIDLLLIEGVMGLFDGAQGGGGATADVAAMLDLPVLLLIDAAAQGQSVAALVRGFSSFRKDCHVAGLIFNRVASPRHEAVLRAAVAPLGIPLLGCLPPRSDLILPSRHLGLKQAGEQEDMASFLVLAASWVERHLDLDALITLAKPLSMPMGSFSYCLPPLGQHMAIARDEAFSFLYQHLIDGWRQAGASLEFFSPLADEAPDPTATAVFLPGGYPELHAGRLSCNQRFLQGVRDAAQRGLVYGECGGFMVLGEGLIDGAGRRHGMAGLLPVVTSFATRERTLGYRRLRHEAGLPWPLHLRGHEFHYSTMTDNRAETCLFTALDAADMPLADMGARRGRVMGSYAHVIDCVSRMETA